MRFFKNNRDYDRKKLLRRLPRNAVVAEVGVFQGDFSRMILDFAAPRQLHCIDPWKYQPESAFADALYGGQAGSQLHMDRIFQRVIERFQADIMQARVVVHRSSSAEAAARFAQGFFDWVYIDGNHTYEYVWDDLCNFAPKIKPGGFLAGDDYATPGWWQDGVTRAVDEFLQRGRAKSIHIEGSQFLLNLN